MKLTWKRNHEREGMSNRDGAPFEWYSAQWWVIGVHVHNKTNDGTWAYKINGVAVRESIRTFATKEEAMRRVEEVINARGKEFASREDVELHL